jgi:hypothetical protein
MLTEIALCMGTLSWYTGVLSWCVGMLCCLCTHGCCLDTQATCESKMFFLKTFNIIVLWFKLILCNVQICC